MSFNDDEGEDKAGFDALNDGDIPTDPQECVMYILEKFTHLQEILSGVKYVFSI